MKKYMPGYIAWAAVLYFCLVSLTWAVETDKSSTEQTTVSIAGRLVLGDIGEVILHSREAQAYVIKGDLREKLKDLVLELGEKNLVSVTGKQGTGSLHCQKSSNYDYNEKGEKILKVEAKCIRYYDLEVTDILFAKKSDEEIPPPQRDVKEEKRLLQQNQPPLFPQVTGEIYGKITSANLKSPIKTIEVVNRDKDNPLKQITLIIKDSTRIAKKLGDQEPIGLGPTALKVDQEITAVYSRVEQQSEALFITVTKE